METNHAATAAAAEGYRFEDFDLGVGDWEDDSDEPAFVDAPAAPATVATAAAQDNHERREAGMQSFALQLMRISYYFSNNGFGRSKMRNRSKTTYHD